MSSPSVPVHIMRIAVELDDIWLKLVALRERALKGGVDPDAYAALVKVCEATSSIIETLEHPE